LNRDVDRQTAVPVTTTERLIIGERLRSTGGRIAFIRWPERRPPDLSKASYLSLPFVHLSRATATAISSTPSSAMVMSCTAIARTTNPASIDGHSTS